MTTQPSQTTEATHATQTTRTTAFAVSALPPAELARVRARGQDDFGNPFVRNPMAGCYMFAVTPA